MSTIGERTDLCDGVRDLVIALNDAGFNTTDSGDGSNFAAGMVCALPFKHVFIAVTAEEISVELIRLKEFMVTREDHAAWEVTTDDTPEDNVPLRFLCLMEHGWEDIAESSTYDPGSIVTDAADIIEFAASFLSTNTEADDRLNVIIAKQEKHRDLKPLE